MLLECIDPVVALICRGGGLAFESAPDAFDLREREKQVAEVIDDFS